MAKSKFFRVAVEGGTTDGRTITREWIEQMAQRYNQNTYGARVNMEHIRGIDPAGMFKMYGDILGAKTEEVDMEGEKRLALFVQIDPTPELIELNKKRQKVYTSVEIHPNLNEKGAYLMGLAVTDSPASLGTEMLQFCAGAGDKSPLASRKTAPECLFTAAIETTIELEDDTPSLFDRVKTMFSRRDAAQGEHLADVHRAVETIATEVTAQSEKSGQQFSELVSTVNALKVTTAKFAELEQTVTDLKNQLEHQPEFSHRRVPATGSDGTTIYTDC